METPQPYSDIFNRLLEGRISPQEAESLIEWLSRDEQPPEAKALILSQLQRLVSDEEVTSDLRTRLEARLPAILGATAHNQSTSSLSVNGLSDGHQPDEQIDSQHSIHRLWLRISSAAAILLLAGTAFYLLARHQQPAQTTAATSAKHNIDIPPGRQGAILTLADGSKVSLDSMNNGIIATQPGTKIVLNKGGLSYSAQSVATEAIAYNTMTTPKGRQFQLSLPDGTKVWLNAASSLKYPTRFSGKDRLVEVTGEAYFEVASDSHPFRVKIDSTSEVQVLGTHFNVNAYTDESTVTTTLLEGSVRIVKGDRKMILQPGQQALTGQNIRLNTNPDLEKVMAWKNGIFDFQDATLEEVMRQLKRWYDIDVIYEKDIPKIEFVGKMGRDLSLSEVLHGLELSKVHFRLEEGRKLVVLP